MILYVISLNDMSRATGALTLLNISNSTAQPRTVFLCVCNAYKGEGQLLEDLLWRKEYCWFYITP